MKITAIDRSQCRRIRAELEHAIDAQGEVWKELGLAVKVGNVSFNSSNMVAKIEVAIIGENGVVETREVRDFKLLAPVYGFEESDLGREFKAGGKTYKIVGCLSRATKAPILAERSDGKQFKFPAAMVKSLLKLETTLT